MCIAACTKEQALVYCISENRIQDERKEQGIEGELESVAGSAQRRASYSSGTHLRSVCVPNAENNGKDVEVVKECTGTQKSMVSLDMDGTRSSRTLGTSGLKQDRSRFIRLGYRGTERLPKDVEPALQWMRLITSLSRDECWGVTCDLRGRAETRCDDFANPTAWTSSQYPDKDGRALRHRSPAVN